MNKQQEALRLALEALENAEYGDYDKKELNKAITAIREALTEESLGTEQPPCKTGSQCTSKCEQCRYKYDCDKAEQPVQQIVEEYDPDKRTISVYPSEWKVQQQEPVAICEYCEKERPVIQAASRPWVGLVMGELPEDGHNHDFLRGAAWAETMLREKNA